MARPFRLFRDYEFFSVLFPGLSSVIFLYLLLPSDIQIGFPAGIIFVIVFAFVFGQALHSLALIIEIMPEIAFRYFDISWSHRQKFAEQLNNPTYIDKYIIDEIRKEASTQLPGFEWNEQFEDNIYSSKEARTLYIHMRSYLHNMEQSRAENIKSMYGFCRNMCVLLYGLIPLYIGYGFLSRQDHYDGIINLEYIDRQGKYIEFFPDYSEFLESAIPLAIIGGTIFLIATFIYQRFFIQYLASDYLIAQNQEDIQRNIYNRYN